MSRDGWKNTRWASRSSHAGIIWIGFEGSSQPRNTAEHPCFNDSIQNRG